MLVCDHGLCAETAAHLAAWLSLRAGDSQKKPQLQQCQSLLRLRTQAQWQTALPHRHVLRSNSRPVPDLSLTAAASTARLSPRAGDSQKKLQLLQCQSLLRLRTQDRWQRALRHRHAFSADNGWWMCSSQGGQSCMTELGGLGTAGRSSEYSPGMALQQMRKAQATAA